MNNRKKNTHPFLVRDCALVTLATGKWAQGLREFRDAVQSVHPDSIYHHFWGRLLQPQFDEPEFNNDFAAWVRHGLHEKELAERLAVIDPTAYDDIREVQSEIVEVVEERLDQTEYIPYAKADQQFFFLRSQIIVFDTGHEADTLEQLGRGIKGMTPSSVYYHFIDARRRNPNRTDDFCFWLESIGEETCSLRQQLCSVDPFFSSLRRLQWRLADIFGEKGRT